MKTVAVLLAAGGSERFGCDKLWVDLEGRPLWFKGYSTLLAHPEVDGVGIVCPAGKVDDFRSLATNAAFVVAGGATRTQSARRGLEAVPDWVEAVLFHDAARPFVSVQLISAVLREVSESGAAFPSVPLTDTIKERGAKAFRTLDRSRLISAQTPQGAKVEHFRRAFATVEEATDDMGLLEAIGVPCADVPGEPQNVKVTTNEDLRRWVGGETRTSIGYDIHKFSADPSRPLWLGGVLFEGEGPGLEGHSDADALIHAVVDALLGAAALGDIGELFPDTDPQWKDEPSRTFLRKSAAALAMKGWDVVNIDVSVVAERPRLSKRRDEIRSVIAELVGISPDRVSVKATTNEGLGSIGRGEGIAAFAVATVRSRT